MFEYLDSSLLSVLFPTGRVEVVSIVTSDTCLEGAVLYPIGLLFGELYEVPTGRAFSSRARVCGCMIATDGVARRLSLSPSLSSSLSVVVALNFVDVVIALDVQHLDPKNFKT